MNIRVGDKITLAKPISVLGERFIGREFDVVGIEKDTVYFKSGFGAGGMSKEEIKECFNIVPQQAHEDVKVNVEFASEKRKSIKEKIMGFIRGN